MGNQADTKVTQSTQGSAGGPDPEGLELLTQVGLVVNAGLATANTGGNQATGNEADNTISGGEQEIGDGPPPVGPVGVASITGDALNSSDGRAAIWTGPARATGNESTTALSQTYESAADGLAVSVAPQVAAVVNLGVASANSGDNFATGNASRQLPEPRTDDPRRGCPRGRRGEQRRRRRTPVGRVGIDPHGQRGRPGQPRRDGPVPGDRPVGSRAQPPARHRGQRRRRQRQHGRQLRHRQRERQLRRREPDRRDRCEQHRDADLFAGTIASNQADLHTASDGTAEVVTGDAHASGNESRTALSQTANGSIDGLGLILNPQVGVVANVGVGVATTGVNRATGNESENDADVFNQEAWIASENDTNDVFLAAPLVVGSNQGRASASSDGSATIHTGSARRDRQPQRDRPLAGGGRSHRRPRRRPQHAGRCRRQPGHRPGQHGRQRRHRQHVGQPGRARPGGARRIRQPRLAAATTTPP